MTEPNLRFPAPSKCWNFQEKGWICGNLRFSAKICVLGALCHLSSITLSSPWSQFTVFLHFTVYAPSKKFSDPIYANPIKNLPTKPECHFSVEPKVRLQVYGYNPFCSHSSRCLAVLVWQYCQGSFLCTQSTRLKWYSFKGFPSHSSHCSGGLFPQYSGAKPELFHWKSGKKKSNKHKHFRRDGVRDKQEPSLGQMGPLPGTKRDPSLGQTGLSLFNSTVKSPFCSVCPWDGWGFVPGTREALKDHFWHDHFDF